MANPLELANEWLLFAVLVVAVTIVIYYRHRFLFLVTGDDRIHADVHSTVWSALTCCRLCTGEWTRYVSVCLCFWHKGLRGRNLKRALGQTFGLVPIPIRFSNIVVGDLPAASCGDFFVAIEVGECPVQITSIAEDANPKVVQFEETLIVRVRNSPAEFSIRFSVRQVNTFGCKELCECYISPTAVVSWADGGCCSRRETSSSHASFCCLKTARQRGPMRFKMEPLNRGLHLNFPPWILVEILSQPEYGTARPWEAPAVFDVQLTELTTRVTSHFRSPTSFKHHYTLLNTHGAKVDEPDEETMGQLDATRRKQVACCKNMCFFLWLISLCFMFVRYYSFACTYEFEKVAMLRNFVEDDFPVPRRTREHLLLKCEMTEPAILRLLEDFLQHTSEGSAHLGHLAENHTGIEIPDEVVSGLSNVTHHAVHHAIHHGSRLAGAAGSLAKRVANATSEHLANLTERAGDVDVGELAGGVADVAGHLADAGASALHHSSRAVDHVVGAERNPRRLESPASSRPSGRSRREKEELACNPDIDDILATCEDFPFGEPWPMLAVPVLGLFSIPVSCIHGSTCKVAMHFEQYDFPYACFLFAWVVIFFCSRRYFAHRIAVMSEHAHALH